MDSGGEEKGPKAATKGTMRGGEIRRRKGSEAVLGRAVAKLWELERDLERELAQRRRAEMQRMVFLLRDQVRRHSHHRHTSLVQLDKVMTLTKCLERLIKDESEVALGPGKRELYRGDSGEKSGGKRCKRGPEAARKCGRKEGAEEKSDSRLDPLEGMNKRFLSEIMLTYREYLRRRGPGPGDACRLRSLESGRHPSSGSPVGPTRCRHRGLCSTVWRDFKNKVNEEFGEFLEKRGGWREDVDCECRKRLKTEFWREFVRGLGGPAPDGEGEREKGGEGVCASAPATDITLGVRDAPTLEPSSSAELRAEKEKATATPAPLHESVSAGGERDPHPRAKKPRPKSVRRREWVPVGAPAPGPAPAPTSEEAGEGPKAEGEGAEGCASCCSRSGRLEVERRGEAEAESVAATVKRRRLDGPVGPRPESRPEKPDGGDLGRKIRREEARKRRSVGEDETGPAPPQPAERPHTGGEEEGEEETSRASAPVGGKRRREEKEKEKDAARPKSCRYRDGERKVAREEYKRRASVGTRPEETGEGADSGQVSGGAEKPPTRKNKGPLPEKRRKGAEGKGEGRCAIGVERREGGTAEERRRYEEIARYVHERVYGAAAAARSLHRDPCPAPEEGRRDRRTESDEKARAGKGAGRETYAYGCSPRRQGGQGAEKALRPAKTRDKSRGGARPAPETPATGGKLDESEGALRDAPPPPETREKEREATATRSTPDGENERKDEGRAEGVRRPRTRGGEETAAPLRDGATRREDRGSDAEESSGPGEPATREKGRGGEDDGGTPPVRPGTRGIDGGEERAPETETDPGEDPAGGATETSLPPTGEGREKGKSGDEAKGKERETPPTRGEEDPEKAGARSKGDGGEESAERSGIRGRETAEEKREGTEAEAESEDAEAKVSTLTGVEGEKGDRSATGEKAALLEAGAGRTETVGEGGDAIAAPDTKDAAEKDGGVGSAATRESWNPGEPAPEEAGSGESRDSATRGTPADEKRAAVPESGGEEGGSRTERWGGVGETLARSVDTGEFLSGASPPSLSFSSWNPEDWGERDARATRSEIPPSSFVPERRSSREEEEEGGEDGEEEDGGLTEVSLSTFTPATSGFISRPLSSSSSGDSKASNKGKGLKKRVRGAWGRLKHKFARRAASQDPRSRRARATVGSTTSASSSVNTLTQDPTTLLFFREDNK